MAPRGLGQPATLAKKAAAAAGLGDRGRRQAVCSEAEDVLGQGGVRERPAGECGVQALEGCPVGAPCRGRAGLEGESCGLGALGREPGHGG